MLYLFLFSVAIASSAAYSASAAAFCWCRLFQFTQQEAQGTGLAVLIPPIGIFAALVYIQNAHARLPVAGTIAAGYIRGALAGALLLPQLLLE